MNKNSDDFHSPGHVAQLVGASSHNQKVEGLILGQDSYFGYGFTPSPHLSALGGNQSMFLSRPFLLSKSNEKMSSGEHLKKIRGYSHQFPHVIE